MSRTAALIAVLFAASAVPAVAGDRSAPDPATAAVPTPPRPASAAERATYDRADALQRSVFWAQQAEIDPNDPVAGVKLAQALREMGQNEQAAETAQAVLVAQPGNVEAMLEVGRAHIARGQPFYGIAALEQARAAAPNDWRPLSLLGIAYTQVRRADEGRAAWNAGLMLSRDNPEILTNAGMALLSEGNAPGAEAMLRRAVAQPTATSKMRLNLAMALGVQGKLGEAEQIIRRELPPEIADRNLSWLRERGQPGAATPTSAAMASAPPAGRTWGSLQAQ